MNPFYIVCMLIALTPLMRGSVHAWPETVIQIIVVLGLIVVVVKGLKKEMRGKKAGPATAGLQRNPTVGAAVNQMRSMGSGTGWLRDGISGG